MKMIFASLAILTLISSQAVAQRGGSPVTPTTLPSNATTTTTLQGSNPGNGQTIQSSGKDSSGNANYGVVIGGVLTGVAAVKAYTACTASPVSMPWCPIWVGVTLVGGKVTLDMSRTKRQSDQTVADVSVGNPTGSDGGSNPNVTVPNPTDNIPGWNVTEDRINDLQRQGWNYDPRTGLVTGPNGQRFPASALNSDAGLASLGLNPEQIAQFNSEMDAAKKRAEDVAKRGTDNGSMFDGDVAGGGGGSGGGSSVSGSGSGGRGGVPAIGLDRDPAQVAGMSRNFNGEPIGVAADSLFDMIDRRYELHERNGSFLPTGP